MDFVSHDNDTIAEMLKVIGVNNIEDLFKDIPKNLIINGLNLPEGLSEPDVLKNLKELGNKNKIYANSFMGAGCYFHYIPTLVDFVISRSEFYTSYTPYQAEASQGYLQAIFEYQSVISRLTQMDVANASMYDGSTALAEAAIMANIITRKNSVLLLEGVHPEYEDVVRTYCWGQNIKFEKINKEDLKNKINDDSAALIFQSPNFFGDIEDMMKEMEEMMERNFEQFRTRIPEEMKRERKLPDGSIVPEWGPFVYGYSMTIGPDGKPVFKEFGNVKPSIKGAPVASKDREPLVDVFIEDKVVRVIAELPGVEKKDINVKTTESKIIIEALSGERKYSAERDLSVRIKPKTAFAKYKNGILELTVERKEPAKVEAGFEVKIE